MMAEVRLLVEFVIDGNRLPEKSQYSDHENAIRDYLELKLRIEHGRIELLRNKLTGSAFLPRQWKVRAWVQLSDIPKLEKVLADERTG